MKIFFIGNVKNNPCTGGEVVNKVNFELLSNIFTGEITALNFEPYNNKFKSIISSLSLWGGGLNKKNEKEIINEINLKNPKYVFISQSLYGRLNKNIKAKYPNIIIISFFHNIEKNYAKELVKVSGIYHIPFLLSAIYNERICAYNSDYIININSKDSHILKKTYNKKTDLVLPISFIDKYNPLEQKDISFETDYLFVGAAFFANIEGIKWFIQEVLPHIPGKLTVVGKEMNVYLNKYKSERVNVFGYVEDLDAYYLNSKLVISPIFSGGGMKTKIAEALMFGKTIIGTNNAFEGYEIDKTFGFICNTKEEFIKTLNYVIINSNYHYFNNYSRQLFINEHSYGSSLIKLRNFFKRIDDER